MKNYLRPINKKGQLDSGPLAALITLVILFSVMTIVVVVNADVIQTIGSDQTAGTAARNASDNALTGVNKISGKFSTLGTVIIAVVIISLMIAGFAGFIRGRTA